MATTKADRWATAMRAATLREVHDELVSLMPGANSELKAQRDYHLASAKAYARIAEVDRGHHHEATYWANREREKAETITKQMRSKAARSS